MIIELANADTRKIQAALTTTRHRMGGAATGKVLTLVIVTSEAAQYDAVRASTQAAREHPSRILGVIPRAAAEETRLDAEVRLGETGPGETVLLRLYGEAAEHADSVVLPLLVPDTPVVIWWPGTPPERPSGDPLGAMAQRRVTDVASGADPLGTLRWLAEAYSPGDTDLAWTRITPWRSLLASVLDRPPDTDITAAEVEAEPDNPSAELLGGWLAARLSVPCEVGSAYGPGITAVRLFTKSGPIAVTRPDGRLATLSRPDQPDRQVALHRRPTAELIAEELRHLDPDQAYQEAVTRYAKGERGPDRMTF
ncbi:glucose-6-phosphate dehydrogenase assembly protein OpcA [Actinoallomurus rhizosphaericola]|uniref:glucose-6-phosphate dehydrogenase assembly protein OpcA n=1 Tax=Actinoallomurus rhizosphaericola TaxID=2952536 RepID=UPI0020931150|nr:glucose-6-phosphate dehydrogenase assembly protein OpcA [Actinoallomurus rhizosphaericola]MCO5998998.1 glucose-6-phosphate dehydrogenase assembly protein OpcA [Actinoallomurus rhizosphaericola]